MSPRFRCAESAQARSPQPVPAMSVVQDVPVPDAEADVMILGVGPRSPWVKCGRISKAEATAAVKRFRESGGSIAGGTITVATVMPVEDGFNLTHWTV